MALKPEMAVAGAASAASAVSPSQLPVLRQGLLRKLKTMRKRYFVLRGDAPGFPARLEYYTSEKKFKDGKGQPRKAVELCSCLGISATASSRASFAVALHTRDDCLTVGFDTEKERDDWLAAMHQLVERRHGRGAATLSSTGSDSDGGSSRGPLFEHVWMINLRPRGLGRGLAGIYRLCLTDRTLSLVKRASSEANLTFPLEVMRRCGHTDNFFFVEVGRQASTGEGELWMEAEDALIAQSAHYAVQRAMHGANTTGLVGTSTSAGLGANSAAPTASTSKTSDGAAGDRRHGSVGSTGRDSSAAWSPPSHPEAAEPPSPAQQSRFSTNAMSLLTRRFSSKNKLATAPAVSLPFTTSALASGMGAAAAACDDDRSVRDSAAQPAAEMGGQQMAAAAGLQLDRASAAASISATSDLRTNGNSHCRASCHEPGDLLARSGSPVPAIEITGAGKDVDDPYIEMSVHDSSSPLSPVTRTDYMEMTPVPRFTCDGLEVASLTSSDPNYLSMQPRTPTSTPRRDSLAGGSASPCGRMAIVAGAAVPRSSLAPSSSPCDATISNGSPTPAGCDAACPAACSSRPALKKGGSQQQLLPDLFNLMPGFSCSGGSNSSGNNACVPSASPITGGTANGYSRSPTGSTSSCQSMSAAAATAPASRSTASLSVPLAQWSEADGTGGSRLRTGSDAPTHRDKLSKQRGSNGQCRGAGDSVSCSQTEPSQRQRSSSHGCVVSSLDSLHRSRLSAMLQASARGLSESASSSAADSVGLPVPLSPDRGSSFEYVAMDFSDAAIASSSAGGSQIAATITALADRNLPPPLHVADPAASSVGATAAIGVPGGSASQDCSGGDYVGIDFSKPSVMPLVPARSEDNGRAGMRFFTGATDGHWHLPPDEDEALLSEPFPELSCSPPPSTTAVPCRSAASELPSPWPTPPRRSAVVSTLGVSSSSPAPPGTSSARSRSRDTSLSFADGLGPVAGGSVSFMLASDSMSARDDPYVMFSGAAASPFGRERPTERLLDAGTDAREPPACDGYAELDLSASGRQLSRDGRLAATDDAAGPELQPVRCETAPSPSVATTSVATVGVVADIRDLTSASVTSAGGSASLAAHSVSDSYADSYAVMNFSVAQQSSTGALSSMLSDLAAASADAPASIVNSNRERVDASGQATELRVRPVPMPLSVASASAAADLYWPGSTDDRAGLPNGNSGTSEAASEGRQQQAASAAAVSLTTPKIAMPVRATCYIKDDDNDSTTTSGDSADNRRASTSERAPHNSSGYVQHSQNLKSSGSRVECGGREPTATAAPRNQRPSSVISLQTSAVSPIATPPLPPRLSPPLTQQQSLPTHDRLPTAAGGQSAAKQRHASGRSSDFAPESAPTPTTAATIVYATLDLEKAAACTAAGGSCAPPRGSVGAVAARPSLARPSSGGSLATAEGNGLATSAARPQSIAGGGVQYSRIDFARLEALKAGKT